VSEVFQKELKFFKPHPNNSEIYSDENQKDDLYESIKEHGVIQPLVCLMDGTIVSGHRRFNRAKILKHKTIPVMIVDPRDSSPEGIIEIMLEYNRYRKKTATEIYREALVYQNVITRKKGAGRTSAHIASLVGIGSARQLERLTYVMQHAPAEIIEKINKDEASISTVYTDLVDLKKEPEVIQKAAAKKVESGTAATLKEAKAQAKAEETTKRMKRLKTDSFSPPYDFINVFPNWDYAEIGRTHPGFQWANPQSEVLESDALVNYEVKGIPFANIGAEKSMVALWVPSELSELAIPVLQAWGYEFACKLFWCKDTPHEAKTVNLLDDCVLECFIGTRGEFQVLNQSNWFSGSASPGSLPEYFYAIIQKFGFEKSIELFTSTQREGFAHYG